MKTKGFTLVETILALSLMGALLVMGGEVWRIMQQIHGLYTDEQTQRYEILRLQHALTEDLTRHLHWQQQGQTLFSLNEAGDTLLQYQFGRPNSQRIQLGQQDVFSLALWLQPFEADAVVCLRDSAQNVLLRMPVWQAARAAP